MSLTLLLLAALAGEAAPCPPPPPPGLHRPPEPLPGLHALHLTEEQHKALQALQARHRPGLDKAREAARSQDERLHQALMDLDLPEADLRARHAASAEARFQAALAHRAFQKEVLALLTAEQKAQLKAQGERGLRRPMPPGPGGAFPPPHGHEGPGREGHDGPGSFPDAPPAL